jgi:hypothetical protein
MMFRSGGDVSLILRSILFENKGLGYLCANENALPNNLWGKYQTLTRLDKIGIVLKGCLGNEIIFRKIGKWSFFRNLLGEPETVVSDTIFSFVQKICPQINRSPAQWRPMTLLNVLSEFSITEKQVNSETAVLLGELFNTEELHHGEFRLEKEQAYPSLYNLLFKAKDDSYQSANELLMIQKHKQANPDEEKRALFAPERFVLSDEYHESGIDFFLMCREKITTSEILAEWVIEAQSETKRTNALRYLLEGEHGDKVARIVREQGIQNTWLAELGPDSSCFSKWSSKDTLEVLFRKLPTTEQLGGKIDLGDGWPGLPPGVMNRYDSKTVLQRVHQWWTDQKEDYIIDYEKRTYPDDFLLNLEEDESGHIDRKSWMVLFALSHFHTMGRQRDIQHKGFIEKCINKGWWDVFSREKPEQRSDEWMQVLEEYINEQTDLSEYEIWMNRFPILYKFSRWLEDFKEAFCSINRMNDFSDISVVLKTRTNPQYQGGGISAPPIEKSLGIGACFTLRELKRKNIINGSFADPLCYVPVKRVRHFFENLGCMDISDNGGIENSKSIHQFLCQNIGEQNVTFSNCFDIPLQIILEKTDIFQTILD